MAGLKIKKPFVKWWCFLIMVILLGTLSIAGCSANKTQSANDTNQVTQEDSKADLEKFIRNLPMLLGTQNVTNKPHLRDLTVNNAGVIINYYPDTGSAIDKKFALEKANEVLKALSKRNDLEKVYINILLSEKDASGNEKDVYLIGLQISQLKLSKINFDKFDYMTLPELADVWNIDDRIADK